MGWGWGAHVLEPQLCPPRPRSSRQAHCPELPQPTTSHLPDSLPPASAHSLPGAQGSCRGLCSCPRCKGRASSVLGTEPKPRCPAQGPACQSTPDDRVPHPLPGTGSSPSRSHLPNTGQGRGHREAGSGRELQLRPSFGSQTLPGEGQPVPQHRGTSLDCGPRAKLIPLRASVPHLCHAHRSGLHSGQPLTVCSSATAAPGPAEPSPPRSAEPATQGQPGGLTPHSVHVP